MTTIKSIFGRELTVDRGVRSSHEVTLECSNDDDGSGRHSRIYSRAELLSALDAVPLSEANQSIEHELEERDRWKARAEEAERKAADFEARYETSHASRMHAEECYRREHDRAEDLREELGKLRSILSHTSYKLQQAEAKLAAVHRVIQGRLHVRTVDIYAALGTEPSKKVVLPTGPTAPPTLVESRIAELSEQLAAMTTHRDSLKQMNRKQEATIINLRAERDAHAATIGRVDKLVASYSGIVRFDFQEFFQQYVRIVNPEPFTLPTEAGVRFEATDNLGKDSTFRAVWSGPNIVYLNERTSVIWNRDNFLDGCIGHRILPAAVEDGGDE